MNGIRELLDDIAAEAQRYEVTEAAVRSGRRRQRIARLAPVGVMLAVVVAAAGVWLPIHGGTAVRTDTATGLGVDVIVGHTLYATDGRRIALPTGDPVSWAYQMRGGDWLISTGQPSGPATVWRVGATGHSRAVLSGVRGALYDPDSRRLVWYTPRSKRVVDGRLSGDRVVDRLSTREEKIDTGAGGLVPAGFSGADWVVLARVPLVVDAKRVLSYAIWYPSQDMVLTVAAVPWVSPQLDSHPTEPVWVQVPSDHGGTALIWAGVLAEGDGRCLTLMWGPDGALNPREQAVCDTRDGDLTATGRLASPTGLTLTEAGTNGKIDVWKVSKVAWGNPEWARKAASDDGAVWRLGKGYLRSIGWLDGDTALVAYRSAATGTDRLYRIGVRPGGTADRLPLPAGASGDVTVVAPVSK